MDKKVTVKKIGLEAIIIIVVAAGLALIVNALRPQGIRLWGHQEPEELFTEDLIPIAEISIDDAQHKFYRKTAIFADARSPEDFAKGHIRGALNTPENSFEEWIDHFLQTVEPVAEIITYCDGAHCPLAKELAEKLYLVGYEHVYYLKDGWSKWQEHSLPTMID